ncbi:calcium/sodium antiporter [Fulvivirga sedimenti]|uniref:Calcium/sodium antiporter n=1 Tax=Fulvivirga sedimenti TaxID=2879465 RepID=A0A9X1HUG9_9BACT|nr:calcium/sodium antiporter [Fulvivirga sedimenti]MCA6078156.1 calcium/sodium antiporter [Fulvivirga sedimenti]
MFSQVAILIAGLIILILGGELLVRGSSSIALKAKISPLVVGLTIVAFGTSAPELLISVKAALAGSPDMTMGNVVGSNICNLALVLGLTALIGPINVNANSIKIDWPVAIGSSLLLYFILKWNPLLNVWTGILFLTILISYTLFIIMKSRRETKAQILEDANFDIPKGSGNVFRDVSFILIGCVGLYYGSDWFVGGARDLAMLLGVSERVIGITVLALGTSLPELVTAIVAAVKGETDLAVGNLMGSNIFNILSILGITSIITPIAVGAEIIRYDLMAMILVTIIILPMMLYKRVIGRISGGILLLLYVYYTYSVIT